MVPVSCPRLVFIELGDEVCTSCGDGEVLISQHAVQSWYRGNLLGFLRLMSGSREGIVDTA